MSLIRKLNTQAKAEINTGFGVNSSDYGGRFTNKNGEANVEKHGIPFLERISWFHTMLSIRTWKFLCIIITFFITVNFLFGIVYYLMGAEHFYGLKNGTEWEKFWEAFFFSTQTFTTVGYGRVSPGGFTTSAVAAFEALLGLLTFSLATGLFYGRFSKPKAYIKFSENALIAPYKNITALMLRIAPFKNATLTEAEAKLTLGMTVEESDKAVNKFFALDLEYEKVNALSLSWTVVHPITENSPLYKFTAADYANTRGEIIIFIKAFDDMFSNTVVKRSSYTFNELVFGAKFLPMYHSNSKGNKTVLDLSRLNSFIEADISNAFSETTQAINS